MLIPVVNWDLLVSLNRSEIKSTCTHVVTLSSDADFSTETWSQPLCRRCRLLLIYPRLPPQSWPSWVEWPPSCGFPSPTCRRKRKTAALTKTDQHSAARPERKQVLLKHWSCCVYVFHLYCTRLWLNSFSKVATIAHYEMLLLVWGDCVWEGAGFTKVAELSVHKDANEKECYVLPRFKWVPKKFFSNKWTDLFRCIYNISFLQLNNRSIQPLDLFHFVTKSLSSCMEGKKQAETRYKNIIYYM